MHAFNVAASLSFFQTVCGGTASSYSPFMVIAITGTPSRADCWASLIYRLPPRAAAEKGGRGLLSACVPGAAQPEMRRCWTGTFTPAGYGTIPDLRRTATALRRVRETRKQRMARQNDGE